MPTDKWDTYQHKDPPPSDKWDDYDRDKSTPKYYIQKSAINLKPVDSVKGTASKKTLKRKYIAGK